MDVTLYHIGNGRMLRVNRDAPEKAGISTERLDGLLWAWRGLLVSLAPTLSDNFECMPDGIMNEQSQWIGKRDL